MKLLVARHGQTNYNDFGLCNSDPKIDVHLTDVGIQQVQELALKLKSVHIDEIFVSELRRTTQTADIINQFHNAPLNVDARLNDNRSGYENKLISEYYNALEKADNKWTVRLNGGESFEDVKDRVRSFLSELRAKDCDAVIVVTSMIIVQVIYGILGNHTNQEAWDLAVDKASYIEFEI